MVGLLFSFVPLAKAETTQLSQQELVQKINVLQEIMRLTKLIESLRAQIAAIIAQQSQQQVAINQIQGNQSVIPSTGAASTPFVEEMKEVPFNTPFAWCGIQSRVNYVSFYCSNIVAGDKFTLSIPGFNPLVETVNKVNGYQSDYSLGFEPGTLSPDTEYSYTFRLQRGNTYALKEGTFRTLSN